MSQSIRNAYELTVDGNHAGEQPIQGHRLTLSFLCEPPEGPEEGITVRVTVVDPGAEEDELAGHALEKFRERLKTSLQNYGISPDHDESMAESRLFRTKKADMDSLAACINASVEGMGINVRRTQDGLNEQALEALALRNTIRAANESLPQIKRISTEQINDIAPVVMGHTYKTSEALLNQVNDALEPPLTEVQGEALFQVLKKLQAASK